MRFKVNEIFQSLQGEGTRAGRPCLFIRLTGCPLRCVYCDTAYAFHEGGFMELEEILEQARTRLGPPGRGPEAPFIEVTGGEPLANPATPDLLRALLGLGHEVALETAGSHSLAAVPKQVVKLVLAEPSDYAWARDWCAQRRIWDRFTVLFSPAWGAVDPAWLAERVLEDRLPVRVQVQLHKVFWGADRTGV